jgi:hypothetical protein
LKCERLELRREICPAVARSRARILRSHRTLNGWRDL